MGKSAEVATATGRAIEKAAQKQAAAQAFAAKYAGDAIEGQTLRIVAARKREIAASADLRKANQLSNTEYLTEVERTNVVAAAIQRLTQAKLAVAAASEVESAAGHVAISNVQAASASIRLAEGGMTNNIRAVERFLSALPGVGAALRTIFPLVGALAFAGLAVEIGSKVYEYGQKGAKAAQEIGDAFDTMNAAGRQTSIGLDITNDKLDIQIAKLEGKPENLLQMALDDDRKAALDLASSVDKAAKAVDDLMAKNGVSLAQRIGGAFFGHNIATTTDTQGVIEDAYGGIKAAGDKGTDNLYNAKPGEAEAVAKANRKLTLDASQEALRKVNAKFASLQQASRDELVKIASARAAGMHGDTPTDYSANLNALSGVRIDLEGNIHDLKARYAASDKQKEVGTDEEKKAAAEKAKAAAAAAREAARRASEKQMADFEQQFAVLKSDHELQVGEEGAFWQRMQNATVAGSENWKKINLKLGEADQAMMRQLDAMQRKRQETLKKNLEVIKQWDASARALNDMLNKGDDEAADGAKELSAILTKNAAARRELAIQDAVSSGQMTTHAAALELATLHARAYGDELERLRAKKKQIAGASYLTDEEKQRQTGAVNEQIARTEGAAARQEVLDRRTIDSSTATGGATEALQEFIAASRNASTQMKDFTASTLSSVNEQLARGMAGQKTSFRSMGAGIANHAAAVGLQMTEGSIMNLFHMGAKKKPMGTADDPLHVTMANKGGAGSKAGGVGSAVSSLLGGASKAAGDAGGGFGSFMGKAAGMAMKFLPMLGFADGGVISPNTWAMVGERGPELFHSGGGGGSIVPNHKLSSVGSGGGSSSFSYNIDARGTDPVQTEMRVRTAIVAAHQSSVHQAVKQVHQQSARQPARSR
jgi:hypothetical protein